MQTNERLPNVLSEIQSRLDLNKGKIPRDYFQRLPEAILKLDYAMVRFTKNEIAFKTENRDPRTFFAIKLLLQHNQVAIHLRLPVKDAWNDLNEFLDLDLYFSTAELEKITRFLQSKMSEAKGK